MIPPKEEYDIPRESELAAVQPVSVSFSINKPGPIFDSFVSALFDTGSPVSFIRKSMAPMRLQVLPLNCTQYSGLGNTRIYSYGQHICFIRFQSNTHSCNVFVIPDEVLPTPILLCRDFLKKAGIGLQFIKPVNLNLKINADKNKNENCVLQKTCNHIETINFPFKSNFIASSFIDLLSTPPVIESSLEHTVT